MNRKIKVVQVLLTLGEGGAQTYFEKMVYAFHDDPDLDQRVITVRVPARLQRFEKAGIPFLSTGNMRSVKRPLRFIQGELARICDLRKINRYLKEFDPDIIVSYHNTAPEIINYPRAIHIARMGHGGNKKQYQRCDYIVVNQPTLRHTIVSKGWPMEKIGVISNFADFPEALQGEAEPLDLPDNAKVVLTLGRLHPAKAQDTLIRAMAHLEDDVHLLIGGTGSLEKKLKALTAELGLSSRVHFLGLRRDVPYLMKRADLVVLPSRYEPLGNVVLEAWYAGKPIVAANSDGPRWLIDHNKNGLLFEIDDAEDCAAQIDRILHMEPAEVDEMVDNGFLKLNQNFTKEIIVGAYKDLFHKLLTHRK